MVRVQAVIDELKQQAAAKRRSAEQFERSGSLVGLGAAPALNAPGAPQPSIQQTGRTMVPSFEEWKRMKAGK
jgi:hypothetical protein